MCFLHQNYREFFKKLNGQKIIILGNHDTEKVYEKLLTENIIHGLYKQKSITIEGQYIYMSHYPHRSWNCSFHGSWHLYGHVHNTCPDYGKSTDVGVDKWNFFPVSFEELKEHFKDRGKHFNDDVKNGYDSYDRRFHKHFKNKYIERVAREAEALDLLI